MPCITYNFLFDNYKKDSNIISGTGLLFIDIDNPCFDIASLDLNKVYAYYKSFGGHGYAVIAKVGNLSLNNFKSTYNYVINELGITEYVDIQAIKPSQFSVISYDKDIYINYDSIIFNSVNVATPSIVIGKEKKAYTIERGAKINSLRFDNLDEIQIEDNYIVNWDGYTYVKCFIPMKKIAKNRNNFLLSYCNNLVWLNPHITTESCLKILGKVNEYACTKPVDITQLKRVIDSIFKYKQQGTLKPIDYWHLRKIVFDSKARLTKAEKLSICRKEIAIKRTSDSRQKIYNILEGWNFEKHGKITQRAMYNNHPVSKKTVEKYWAEFKEFICKLNNSTDLKLIDNNNSSKEETIVVEAHDVNFSVSQRALILEKISKGEHPEFINAIIKFDENDFIQDKVMIIHNDLYDKTQYVTHTFIYNPCLSYGT